MDHLALSVSKAITDYLEQNEKRFVGYEERFVSFTQHQHKHLELLQNLNSRVEQLETKCKELTTENESLKNELDSIKQRQEVATKDIITTKSDHERMQKQVDDCSKWTQLTTTLAGMVQSHDESLKELIELPKNQSQITQQLEKHQKLLNATAATAAKAEAIAAKAKATASKAEATASNAEATAAKADATAASVASLSISNPTNFTAPQYTIRTPIRSPSTSSFFNGNMNRNHSSTPHRHRLSTNNVNNFNNNNDHLDNIHQSSHYSGSDYNESIDHNDMLIEEMSENAESLRKSLYAINKLQQRSFGGSICNGE